MRTPLRFAITAFVLLSCASAFACLNEYQRSEIPVIQNQLELSKLLGSPLKNVRPYWHHGFDMEGLQERLNKFKQKGLQTLNYRDLSDYAVLELKIGDKRKAVSILEELYNKHPKEYNIVANLGTAYELTGDKTKALDMLKRSLLLNPGAHYGSEWIHVRILEEELSASPDHKKIVNLGITDFSYWLTDKAYKFPHPADSLKLQIAYQLHERIAFIAPPNAVIGQLVTDFADIVAKTDSIGAAKSFYDYALSYDRQLQDSIASRITAIEGSQKEVKNTFRWASIVWAIPLLALVMVFLAWLRNVRQNKNKQGIPHRSGPRK